MYSRILSEKFIGSVDRSNLIGVYEKWPIHAKHARKIKPSLPPDRMIKNVLFVGIGGSATSGDILQSCFRGIASVPLEVLRDYHIPNYVGKNTLVLAASCSGNTEETITAAYEAKIKGAIVTTISSGGILEEFSKKYGIPHTRTTTLQVPRASLLYMLIPSINILHKIGIIPSPQRDLNDLIDSLEKSYRKITIRSPYRKNEAKAIAKKILHHLPSIYSDIQLSPVAYRFKTSLNENSKARALQISFPELCHNEVLSRKKDDVIKAIPIFLRERNERPEVRERFEAFASILRKTGKSPLEVKADGNTPLGMIVSMIYMLDYTSLYLAVLRGVDPTPTQHIDEIKMTLKKKLNYLENIMGPDR